MTRVCHTNRELWVILGFISSLLLYYRDQRLFRYSFHHGLNIWDYTRNIVWVRERLLCVWWSGQSGSRGSHPIASPHSHIIATLLVMGIDTFCVVMVTGRGGGPLCIVAALQPPLVRPLFHP